MLLAAPRVRLALIVVLASLFSVAMPAAGRAADDKADAPSSAKADSKAAKSSDKADADPFQVPEGTPEELLKFIRGLAQQKPPAGDIAAQRAFFKKLTDATVTAAERIIADKRAAPPQLQEAVHTKLALLRLLAQMGDKDALARLDAFPAQLEKAGRKEFVRPAESIRLSIQVGEALRKGGAELAKATESVRKHMAAGPITGTEAELAMRLCMMSEQTDEKQAASLCREFAKIFGEQAKSTPQFGRLSRQLEGAARRLSLVGSPLELKAGATLDGKPLNWPSYKGKTVVVTFWATWCMPCRMEIKVLQELYRDYHDKGLEIVAISVDREREALVEYLKKEPVPWTVITDASTGEGKDDATAASYYGVFAIPQLFLVGKDGKVVATSGQLRGPKLREALEKIYGPVESKPAKSSPKPAESSKTGE